jgi:DNA-binding response OmpR family regulator
MTKILLVEDDIFLVKVYKLKLEKQGYEVMYLQDGSQVAEHVASFKPDLILLDIVMPIKDGFQVLTELKSNPKTANIPILILSALQMEKDVARGKELGADEYLPKTNVTFDQVIESIQKLTT